jgi:hypothetical protein
MCHVPKDTENIFIHSFNRWLYPIPIIILFLSRGISFSYYYPVIIACYEIIIYLVVRSRGSACILGELIQSDFRIAALVKS